MNARHAKALSAAVLALIAAGASGPEIARQYLNEREGRELRAYQDGANVWTICQGKTEGVHAGDTATPAECDAWLDSEIGRRFAAVDRMLDVELSAPAMAGVVAFCHNVGLAGCRTSTLIRELNAGNTRRACDSMMWWKYITRDGVKIDCSRDDQLWCGGLIRHREGTRELCLL